MYTYATCHMCAPIVSVLSSPVLSSSDVFPPLLSLDGDGSLAERVEKVCLSLESRSLPHGRPMIIA